MISINKELNNRLFMQNEQQNNHFVYNHEFEFYNNVIAGDIEGVKKVFLDPNNENFYINGGYGILSNDKLRNIRYHFVVSVALITRLCVENGLEHELAFTLSDLYISKMDALSTARQIFMLNNDMLLDFTRKMADLPKKKIYSIQIVKAIEYIYNHRTERLTVESTAKNLNISRSYLSTLFKQETGTSISSFIRTEKIKAAANLLKFSDYTYSEIAEYFGFSSQSHFIQCFSKEMGHTPKEFRNLTEKHLTSSYE